MCRRLLIESMGSPVYKTKRWKQLRLSVIAKQPCCVICEEKGRIKAATVVDHIIAHKGSDALMWDVRDTKEGKAAKEAASKEITDKADEGKGTKMKKETYDEKWFDVKI